MPYETWDDHPQQHDVISRTIFFDELRENLIAVIKDYQGLGINNEPQLIRQAETLFKGDLVPSRKDWTILNDTLAELSTVKEFSTLQRNFFGDIDPTLGVTDLQEIRTFLDLVQQMDPQPPGLTIDLPVPNRTVMNAPTISSTNDFKTSIKIDWTVNAASLAIKNATITGRHSVSEDMASYKLDITAGSASWTNTFNATQAVTRSIPLTWPSWYTTQTINEATLSATLTATDKRGNIRVARRTASYPANTRMQTPLVRYGVQYKLDNGAWVGLGETTSLTMTWTSLPKKNGTYYFRVRGIDQLGQWTDWKEGPGKYLSYLPDPPGKPNPKYTSTAKTITITWAAVAGAEYYEVHNWTNMQKAKDESKNGNHYYQRVNANQTRSVTLRNFSPDNTHGIYVRATNTGGHATGYVAAKTKPLPLRKKTYNSVRSRVWRTKYDFMNASGRVVSSSGPEWRTEKDTIYQGEWKEPIDGVYKNRGGNGAWYGAYSGQAWGNHMSFIFFNYGNIRTELSGKKIQKVTIKLNRNTAGAHGFPSATPLYLYNHNRDDSNSATVGNAFTLFRADNRAAVTQNNQRSAANVQFNRGEAENISNAYTKQLLENIVNGSMRGLGIVKYYGAYLGSHVTFSDKAYMRLSNKVTMEVEYYDE